jgi:arginyl-tRNA synthetase
MIDHILTLASERHVVEVSDGASIVRIPGEDAPLILKKADGATIYATRDLAALHYRIETYDPGRLLYVVGNEQALHFRQVFAAAGLLGLVPDGVQLEHIKFGLVRTTEGKLSTRRGRTIFLADVLDEAAARASAVIEARAGERGSDRATALIAERVGVAAVKYFDLSHDRRHDVVFDWDRMLNLKGDSAPYLLYSYTRAASILRKAAGEASGVGSRPSSEAHAASGSAPSTHPIETAQDKHSPLVRTLAKFPLTLETVVADNAPHHLAQYLNQLAAEFHRFYEHSPVLSSDGDERLTRLAIVAATANVLKRGLDLLGISVLETM